MDDPSPPPLAVRIDKTLVDPGSTGGDISRSAFEAATGRLIVRVPDRAGVAGAGHGGVTVLVGLRDAVIVLDAVLGTGRTGSERVDA